MDSAASPDYFIGVAQQAMWVLALATAPILIPALVAGIILGMIQAATSINEQTLSFVPKLIVVAVCLALFGSGPQAAHHVDAMLAVRPIERVLITGRDPGRAEKLADEIRNRFGIEAVAGPNPAMLRDATIICTVTNARAPLFEAGDVHPEAHINAIGAYRPDMCELPAALLRDAAIFADSKIPVAREAGDLLAAFGSPEAVAAHLRAIGELITSPLSASSASLLMPPCAASSHFFGCGPKIL